MITDWRFFLQSFGAMGVGVVLLAVRHLAIVYVPERYAGVARTISSFASARSKSIRSAPSRHARFPANTRRRSPEYS